MNDLERRALLGDRQAQEECTQRGIVLPCWRCGGQAEARQVSGVGRPLYAVSCKKHYCGAYGCAHRTEKEAISYWNRRPAPPIGRCGECEYKPTCINYGCMEDGAGFCKWFKPKGGEENG